MFVNPPELEECRTYAEFKGKVKAWKGLTHVPDTQRGAVIAYNITNDSKFGADLQDHLYDELDQEKLNDDKEGLEKVLKILDKYLQNTGMGLAAERFDAFINTKRKSSQSIKQYIGHYEKVCKNYAESIGSLSQMAKALMLLRTAKLTDTQYEMILAMSEGQQDQDTLYDKIKAAITTQLTDKLNDVKGAIKETSAEGAFAAEGTFIAEGAYVINSDDDEQTANAKEVLAASFYKKQAWRKKQISHHNQKPPQKQQYNYKNSNKSYGNASTQQKEQQSDEERCFFCRSKTHTIKDCFQAKKMRSQYLNRKRNNNMYYANVTEGDQRSQQNQEGNNPGSDSDTDGHPIGSVCISDNFLTQAKASRFTEEAKNCAAIDTCCSQTVSGPQWFKAYKEKIPKDIQHYIQGPKSTNQYFRFGDNKVLKANERWTVPAYLGGKLVLLELFIIPSDIPMLLSKSDLQASEAVLYMKEDMAKINGKMVHLKTTTAGHYIVPLLENDDKQSILMLCDVFAIDLLNATPQEQLKQLHKMHKQFGHRPKQAFIDVLKHANSWSNDFNDMLDKIIDSCEGCIVRRRNPDRPVVAMLMAKDVNDTVAMDLKNLKNGKHILYMIDTYSRFTVAKLINRKKPEEVIDAVMEKWVSIFGTPSRFITDNGGEFSNEEMQLAANKLNIIHKTTAAESPWQNGLCERNHATVDNILEALEKDYPKIPLQTLLLWACVAKNSMLMVQGFSPYQIMFGRNPKLPNIITDPLPAWENEGISNTLVKHLEALKATRKAFIESEDSKRLKLALENKVRTNNEIYHNGDSIYFKRAGLSGWHNGKVVFQDGKVIFIRSGTFFYRCSANRIIKAGKELAAKQAQEENYESESINEDEDNQDNLPPQETSEQQENTNTNNTTPLQKGSLEGNNPDNNTNNNLECNTPESDTDSNSPNEDTTENDTPPTPTNNKKPGSKKKTRPALKTKTKRGRKPTPQSNFSIPTLQVDDLIECKYNGVWTTGKVLGRAGKATSAKSKHAYNVALQCKGDIWLDVSKIETRKITEEDILALWMHEEVMATMLSPEKKNSPECLKAKELELEKLRSFDTFEEIPDNGQDAISTTWVLTEKENEIRARLTARGFEEESNIRSDSPTVQSTSMRYLLMIAATKQWPISTIDIKSAFLQGQELKREVIVKPPREANSKGKLWRLKKCLYGLSDASRAWYEEMDSRFEAMKFQKSCQDSAFFIYKENGITKGIVAIHVDDFLFAGDKHFTEHIIPKLLNGLVIGKTEVGEFVYTGFHIKQDESGITLDQDDYLNHIEIPKLDAQRLKQGTSRLKPEETTIFRLIMGKVNWVARGSRPDCGFDTVYLSTRFHRGTVDDVKEAAKVLSKMQINKSYITVPNLDSFDDLEIWAFSDASLGNVDNKKGSVGAFIIFIANKSTGKAAPIAWKAAKIKRVATSTFEAETLAMYEAMTTAIGIQKISEEVLGSRIPILGVVDNYSTYEIVKTNKQCSNAGLKPEIFRVKQMQKQKHVEKIIWLQGENMIADCMTKKGKSGLELLEVLQTGYLGKSMEAANGSEYIMTYDPKDDPELGEYILKW